MIDHRLWFKSAVFIALCLLLIAATSQREISWPEGRVRHADAILTLEDTSTIPLVTFGVGCGHVLWSNWTAGSYHLSACYPAPGTKHIIRSMRYRITTALTTDNQCTVGLAVVTGFGDFAAVDFIDDLKTDIGDTTTPTCDSSDIATGSDLDEAGDWCINNAVVEIESGDKYAILADAATPGNCDGVKFSVFIERDIVILD